MEANLSTRQTLRGSALDGVGDVDAVDAGDVGVEEAHGDAAVRLLRRPSLLLERPVERVGRVLVDGEAKVLPPRPATPRLDHRHASARRTLFIIIPNRSIESTLPF